MIAYNLVNENNAASPTYDLSKEEIDVEIFISPGDKICIIGRADPNYLVWLSVTDINDTEVNEKIFNTIAQSTFHHYSSAYKVWGNNSPYELKDWYRCEVRRAEGKGFKWQTPFGHYYGDNGLDDQHGTFFARDIQILQRNLRKMCEFRMKDGLYLDVLSYYRVLLDDAEKYEDIKFLHDILEKESYLRMSPDSIVREIYLDCMNRSKYLYNRYQDRIR